MVLLVGFLFKGLFLKLAQRSKAIKVKDYPDVCVCVCVYDDTPRSKRIQAGKFEKCWRG